MKKIYFYVNPDGIFIVDENGREIAAFEQPYWSHWSDSQVKVLCQIETRYYLDIGASLKSIVAHLGGVELVDISHPAWKTRVNQDAVFTRIRDFESRNLRNLLRASALAKLTPEEREALDL